MRLDDHVQTNNNIETTRDSYGVCISMTTQWISASRQHGGVTRTWQIGSGGAFLVRQAAGMIGQQRGDDAIIRNAGLQVLGQVDDPALIGLGTPGYHILSIWNGAGDAGHSMGSRVDGTTFEFFDPNFGLYRADSAMALAHDVRAHCAQYYADLNAEYVIRNIA